MSFYPHKEEVEMEWKSAALVIEEGVDLRDPKLSVMADGRLLLISGGCLYDGDRYLTRAPRVAFSMFPMKARPASIWPRSVFDRALSGWVSFPIRRPSGLRPNWGKSREKRTQSE